jgi:RecB family endonuclease NucS
MFPLADPDPLTLQQLIAFLPQAGSVTILVAFCWLWYTGKIVTRRELDAAEQRAAMWQSVALRSLGNNERVSRAAEQATNLVGTALNSIPPAGSDQ